MNWTEKQIHYVLSDLISENPLACHALLSIAKVEFTDNVPTMAVTISAKPVLKINLKFCRAHLKTENDVKAVLLHEFLHVLFLHTEKYKHNTPLLNIALDAIINATIFRYKGMEYADFFVRFYNWEFMTFLLRPETENESFSSRDMKEDGDWVHIHKAIYSGKYCADDLHELLEYLRSKYGEAKFDVDITLLGNHGSAGQTISEEVKSILDGIMKKMDGSLIWNKPHARGLSEKPVNEKTRIGQFLKTKWQKATLAMLKKCLEPDPRKHEMEENDMIMPVMCSSDRRAIARFSHSAMIPLSKNPVRKKSIGHGVHIYLDVSGSMNNEINDLIALLNHFRKYIRMPLLVFSGVISEAKFSSGKLIYQGTGGTTIGCVFDHIRENNIAKSLIVTDGYVEQITSGMLQDINRQNLQIIVSADGNPQMFHDLKIPYHQLEKINP